MNKKIQYKLILSMLLLTVIVIAFVGATLFISITLDYYRDFDTVINDLFTDSRFTELLGEDVDPDKVLEYIKQNESLLNSQSQKDYYLFKDGNIIKGNKTGGLLSNSKNLNAVLEGKTVPAPSLFSDQLDWGRQIGAGYAIYIRDDRTALFDNMKNISVLFLQALLAGFAVAALLSYIIARRITVPIKKLTNGARQMQGGNFEKITVKSKDEVGKLTEVFNEMGQTLISEQKKLDDIIEHIQQPVCAIDINGGLIHANRAYYENINKKLDIMSTRDIEYIDNKIYSVDKSQLDSQGSVLLVFTDITEFENLEKLRKEFIANVSHELKTPITVIKSYSETLCCQPVDSNTTLKFLNIINNESDRLSEIVNQLLELTRLESGKEPAHPYEQVQLNSLISEIYQSLKIECDKKELKLSQSGSLIVNSQPYKLKSILINLISNAIKYSNPGGSIECRIEKDEKYAVIKVIDNGIGIEKQHLPYLFDKFYRVDKSRVRQTGGSGLGLAIAKQQVLSLGGDISVSSEPGEYTCFTVQIPINL